MNTLTPLFNFTLKSKQWLAESHKFDLKIRSKVNQPAGWFRISIKAKNKAALAFIADQGNFWLHQNHNTIGANLLKEADDKLALVFLRHNPLKALTLHWHTLSTSGVAPEFAVKVSAISPAVAWYHMMAQVSRKHVKEGISRSYIFRITRARSKRAGKEIALSKLVKEYHPQLSYQLVSCEPYTYWRTTREPLLIQQRQLPNLDNSVQFHIIVRAKDNAKALQQTLNSVKRQTHTNWQISLCEITPALTEVAKREIELDKRMSLQTSFTPTNETYFIFLQEGDLLKPETLSILSKQLSVSASDIIYADHDLLNADGMRVAPRFKPDWSPDFLMHHNYIGMAFTVKAQLLQHLMTDNNWFLQHHYCLLLAAVKRIAPDKRAEHIKHLPMILFHQAQKNLKLGYTSAMLASVKKHLQDLAKQNNEQLLKVTKGKSDLLFHLHYAIPKPWPLVSLIIPTRDALELTRTCVNSILYLTQYPHYEIIIVDNQSSDPETLDWFTQINQHEKVRVIHYDKAFNYSAINNFAVSHAKGSVIGLVNNDTEVINKEWLTEMLQHACRPEIGCVGAKLYFFDDTIQHAGVILGLWGLAGHAHKHYLKFDKGHQSRLLSVQNFSAVTAACLLIRKSVYEEVGGLEEYHLTVAFNDVDLCLKVKQAGYRNLWTPYAELYHYESKSRGKEDTPEKKAREQGEISYMQQKWPSEIAHDPFYNPNLTRSREDFSINLDD
ncbi:glycosyltransferase family 2 protein [Rheinheimera sp. UJ51]|uniref:glycosyltransferase family 2 protein n=1 Tax=Rheinheimera sp. UJ51 TaxID=2892446 RepID=UPI001E35B36D|nr:glycosyltransferase family 2 protein [Rheinheimera sp. UJ51]MCC5450269.1 glycosyltransferase family 2 protein [Rheinheimera sp. UJ51]